MLFAYIDVLDLPRLCVVDFVKESPRRCQLDELETSFEVEYPPLSKCDVYLGDIQLRADPGCFVDSRPGGPFSQDTKDFIIVLTTSVLVRGRDQYVLQFISAQHLLEVVEEYASISRASNGRLRPPVSYIEWVHDTRIRVIGDAAEPSDVWICYVCGNRYVLGAPTTRDGVCGLGVKVMDFNQLALKRDAQPSTESDYSGYIKTQPEQIPKHKPFDDELETCLPYRRHSLFLEGGHGHCKAMCTEDSIVIVDVSVLFCRKCAYLTRNGICSRNAWNIECSYSEAS